MNTATESNDEPRISASTLRVRRHRMRRREGLRQFTVDVPKSVIEQALTRGLLAPEDRANPWPGLLLRLPLRRGPGVAYQRRGDHRRPAGQCGGDPPQHQRLAGAGSTIRRV
jgi:hypothetical protein